MRRRDLMRTALAARRALAPFAAAAQPGLPVVGYLGAAPRRPKRANRTAFLRRTGATGLCRRPECCDRVSIRRGQLDRLPVSRGRAGRGFRRRCAGRGRGAGRSRGEEGDQRRSRSCSARGLRPGAARASSQASAARAATRREYHLSRPSWSKAPGAAARAPAAARTDRVSLVDPRMPGTPPQVRDVETAAQTARATDSGDAQRPATTMSRRRSRRWRNARRAALFSVASTVFPGDRRQARRTRRPHHIPAVYEWREFVGAGGLDELQREARRRLRQSSANTSDAF